MLGPGFPWFVWLPLFLDTFHHPDIILPLLHSALNTETPPLRLAFAESARWPHDNSIVSMLNYHQSSLFLGVQSLQLRDWQAGGYGQRRESGNGFSQSSVLIRQQEVVQCPSPSALGFIDVMLLCSRQKMVPSRVTHVFLLYLQGNLSFAAVQDLLS